MPFNNFGRQISGKRGCSPLIAFIFNVGHPKISSQAQMEGSIPEKSFPQNEKISLKPIGY